MGNIKPDQEKIFDTIHNLVWYRITKNERYLDAITENNSTDFNDCIYWIRYDFNGSDDSVIRAIVYLNGNHYEYTNAPEISTNPIWVNNIPDSEVESKIIEIGGQVEEDFGLYPPEIDYDDPAIKGFTKRLQKPDAAFIYPPSSDDYNDLPF